MSQYTAALIEGKTVWLPKQQEAQPLPKPTPAKPKRQVPQRTGKRYGERKNWW